MKKYIVVMICLIISFIIMGMNAYQTSSQPMHMYPNLPSPIGKEPILITSAGQSVEGGMVENIARQLHLDADYRPRALATDLYEYDTIIIILGYSYNGLLHKQRQFEQERKRIRKLAQQAEHSGKPIVLIDLDVEYRDNQETWKLTEEVLSYADYFIGRRHEKPLDTLLENLEHYHIPSTFVDQLEDLKTPFNSVFR
ncbi:DUF6305 family protein [Thalassobacillus hwangdonensis]|uniref:DUF6305 family protein n=1 Tax=Thalassobacillus hwangdonensis TaxID=546108 RepID=A0ABW3L708_9BACI